MSKQTEAALREGLADGIGFLVGALGGWLLGQQFGLDFVNTPGYGLPQIASLVLIVAGSGLGRWLLRRLLIKSKP
jgi:hypothetical protein